MSLLVSAGVSGCAECLPVLFDRHVSELIDDGLCEVCGRPAARFHPTVLALGPLLVTGRELPSVPALRARAGRGALVTGAPAPRYLSVDECAALLAVDHKTIRRLIKCEKLPALLVGRLWRIDPADLERLRYHGPRGGEGPACAPSADPRGVRTSSAARGERGALRLPRRPQAAGAATGTPAPPTTPGGTPDDAR